MARWRPTTGDALLAVKPRLGPSMPEAAFEWEKQALLALSGVAHRWMDG